ncbi:hypothetical protein GUJ93_ZPchr0015g6695 [Zizania palustris]|uniref:Uncharacterized protein n=1 Tax=Zizania palustris TaxID=103762 RepID=A0A8J5W664_ZIZPA|nr:hypothetical protein GUJ93_ZPchr0015g6695 [Zizania palustris]
MQTDTLKELLAFNLIQKTITFCDHHVFMSLDMVLMLHVRSSQLREAGTFSQLLVNYHDLLVLLIMIQRYPHCKMANYAVEYRGVKTKEEKGHEQLFNAMLSSQVQHTELLLKTLERLKQT